MARPGGLFKATGMGLLSLLIALFPKCPFCWAAYLSMIAGVSMSQLPYMPWLYPVLLVVMGLYLLLLLRNVKRTGWIPFAASILGTVLLLLSRLDIQLAWWLMVSGITLVTVAALWNTFGNTRATLKNHNNPSSTSFQGKDYGPFLPNPNP